MARNDFTNDGVSDLVFRNGSTIALWEFDAGGARNFVTVGQASTDWKIVGSGDYNGDGTDDLLFRQDGTGAVGYWSIQNGVSSGFVPLIWNTGSDWSIVGSHNSSDFNGDGRDDILWRNANGDLGIYTMTGSGAGEFTWNVLGNVSTEWKVLTTDDFNGDGRDDILWRNSSTGQVGYYAMNGGVTAWVSLGNASESNWSFLGTADFDGDGAADILWQSKSASLYQGFWDINGGQLAGFVAAAQRPAFGTSVTFGDYTGDSSEDIAQVTRFGSFVPTLSTIIQDHDAGVYTASLNFGSYSFWDLII